eukprot:2927555-Prymnesium_polylepis.1
MGCPLAEHGHNRGALAALHPTMLQMGETAPHNQQPTTASAIQQDLLSGSLVWPHLSSCLVAPSKPQCRWLLRRL